MKKIYLLSAILFFVVNRSFSQAPGIKWQKCIGGTYNEAMFDLNAEMYSTTYYPVKTKGFLLAKEGGYFIAGQTNSANGDVPINRAYNQPGTIALLRLDASGNTLWKKTLGGDTTSSGSYDQFKAIIQTADKGCIVMGETTSATGQAAGNHGKNDIILGKFSATGNLEWSGMYGGPDDEYGMSIVETNDSGYIFLGITSSNSGQVAGNHGLNDVWMVKINKAGVLQWQKCIGSEGYDGALKIEKTSDNGFLYVWQGGTCSGITFTKIDSVGTQLWQGCVPALMSFGGMSATADGGHIIAGQGPNQSGMAVKIDKDANIQWQKTLNGSKNDMFNDAKQTADGGYIICGNSESYDGDLTGLGSYASRTSPYPKSDVWIIKLDAAGQLQWQKLIGGSEAEITSSIFATADNEYIFFGTTDSHDGDIVSIHQNPNPYNPTVDWWMVKLSASNTIQGEAFEDLNRNGVKDQGEVAAENVRIKSVKGTDERITIPFAGHFTNYIDTGSYITTVTPVNPYFTAQPSSHTTSFSTYNNTDTLHIAIQPIPGKRDVLVSLIPVTSVRPGFVAQYKLFYKNQGTDTVESGTVQFVKSNNLTLKSANPAYTSTNGDTLKWNYANLKPQDDATILLEFTVAPPPAVNIGDLVTSIATITSGVTDLTPPDNISRSVQKVIGSFDPNDKTETHGGVLTQKQLSNSEWLQYTIRFQNTGTDTAFNLSIRDTLSNKLNWNSLQMVSASHPYQLNIKDGNKCTWQFDNIKLVDSNRNEPASHGYIVYRIKPAATFIAGDTIKNTAAIFFDYNLPVKTNTEKTVLESSSLPVTLLSFQATRAGKTNAIHWSTSKEMNVSSFEVERSTDGRNFFMIGKRNPSVNADWNNLYELTDDNPAKAINYYRLKMIDKDGSIRYSTIKIIDNSASYTVTAFPNPATNKLSLKIDSEKNTGVQIEIITQDGKTVVTSKTPVTAGSAYHNINVTSLTPGTYYVKIRIGTEQSIVRFEKL